MLANRQHVEQHIQWNLQAGNCFFWWDNWLGTGPLTQFTSNTKRYNNKSVAKFWEGRNWNWSRLIKQAPVSQFSNIFSTKIPSQLHLKDQAAWNLTNHDNFTCSSAWEEIREKRDKQHFNSLLWNKHIPFKTSFLLWRTLRGKLPTNEKLTIFGIEPSKCFCCTDNSGMDRIQHTFTSGQFAAKVWRNFADTKDLNNAALTTTTASALLNSKGKQCCTQDAAVGHHYLHMFECTEE